jgi:hypothetical protein
VSAQIPRTPPPGPEFVARLERWRQSLGLDHNVFARDVLGVDKTTWSLVRRGLAPANPKFIGRVVQRYPWLARFLGEEEPDARLP